MTRKMLLICVAFVFVLGLGAAGCKTTGIKEPKAVAEDSGEDKKKPQKKTPEKEVVQSEPINEVEERVDAIKPGETPEDPEEKETREKNAAEMAALGETLCGALDADDGSFAASLEEKYSAKLGLLSGLKAENEETYKQLKGEGKTLDEMMDAALDIVYREGVTFDDMAASWRRDLEALVPAGSGACGIQAAEKVECQKMNRKISGAGLSGGVLDVSYDDLKTVMEDYEINECAVVDMAPGPEKKFGVDVVKIGGEWKIINLRP